MANREALLDIRGVWKQPLDVPTSIRMARCDISSLKTKQFETKIKRISCFNLGSTQHGVATFVPSLDELY